MTIDEVLDQIEPLLECGALCLTVTARPGGPDERPPAVFIAVAGGVKALERAADDHIILAMRNATAIGDTLRRELPKHWEVYS